MLDGAIQAIFGAAFSGLYLDGTIIAVTITDDGAGGGSSSPTSEPCKLQVDACTHRQKLEVGYTARDVRIIVLQSGVTRKPRPGNRITAKGVTYTIGPTVTEDPAASYWELRCVPL